MFADNGPAVSRLAYEAYDRLDIRLYRAAPDAPQQKGGEEALIGRLEKAQSRDPGGYRRTTRERDRAAKRIAKLVACQTQWDIEREVVLDLIDENATVNKRHLLTTEMRDTSVRGCADEMFSWWVRRMGGVEMRLLSEADVYRALLNHKVCNVTRMGVKLNGAVYNSDSLRLYRDLTAGKLSLDVLYHPSRPEEAYWVTNEVRLDPLEREKSAAERYGRRTTLEIEMLAQAEAATEILVQGKRRRRRGDKLTVRQAQVLLQKESAKPKRLRSQPTPDIAGTRARQLKTEREARPYDKPELHAPDTTKSNVVSFPTKATAHAPDSNRPSERPAAGPGDIKSTLPAAVPVSPSPRPAAKSGGRVRSADLWMKDEDLE